MINLDLVKYLSEGKRRGFSINLLKSKLLEAGFKETDVNEAIDYLNRQTMKVPTTTQPSSNLMHHEPSVPAEKIAPKVEQPQPIVEKQPTPTQTTQPEKLGLFGKIGKSIAHPVELFEKTKGEGVWAALKYLLVILIVPFVLISLLAVFFVGFLVSILSKLGGEVAGSLLFLSSGEMTVTATLMTVLSIAVSIFIVFPILLFISVAILHLFAKAYKGKGNYSDSFGTTVYSSTPQIIFFFIPVIGIWSLVLSLFGLSVRHNFSKGRAFLTIITPSIIFAIIWLVAVTIITFLI